MTEKLFEILKGYGIVTDLSRKLFLEKTTIIELTKNTDILLEGEKNNSEYILISGVAHRYNISDKGDMVTTGFYMSGAVITPHFARTKEGKSIFSLQSLSDIHIAELTATELDFLRYSNEECFKFGQQVLENELVRTFYNEVVFRSYNAKERLLILRRQFPNLENLIPHNIIASYLGITNVSFSRLRAEISRQ